MYRCYIFSGYKQEKREKERQDLFYQLMGAVWSGDVEGTVKILARDQSLANYRQFTFHLPDKTNSILDYAKVLNHETIVQVLQGFGARSGTST